MKRIAVLLTCHNRRDKTLSCLNKLFLQEYNVHVLVRVFLTDDGSSDGTSDAVRRLFPEVQIIRGDGSLFWNGGMIRSWHAATKEGDFDYYMWLNDDTFLFQNALQELLNTSSFFDDRCLIVGSTTSTLGCGNITYGGRKANDTLLDASSEIQECEYFNGNIVLVPRWVYNVVGYNDSSFRHALGDYDYGRRASKLGIKSYVASGVLGECDVHDKLPLWCDPKAPFSARVRSFKTPLGMNPAEFFKYDLRHNGLFSAIKHYITIHVRLFFPHLWLKSS